MAVAPKGINKENISKGLHASLMTAGMIPGVGVAADLIDSALYASEGNIKDSLWSILAAVPLIGSLGAFVKINKRASSKLLKVLSEGREPGKIDIFRGDVRNPVEIYKDFKRQGNVYRGGKRYKGSLYGTQSPLIASGYQDSASLGKLAEREIVGTPYTGNWDIYDNFFNNPPSGGTLLHFRIDEDKLIDRVVGGSDWRSLGRIGEDVGSRGILMPGARELEFPEGLLEEFVHKIYKAEDVGKRIKLPKLWESR
jgi:hypothetical protein|tara:strand:+ start:29 stop:790 length:762 start_codon:yes stop_codon:yes gene_type:complete